VDEWLKDHQSMVDRWLALQSEMRGSGTTDQAVFTVAIRELMDLAQSSNGLKTLY
jgi:glutamate dehydrogenase